MLRTIEERRIPWGRATVDWAAVDSGDGRNAMWRYCLDGLTYFGFPFDPTEQRVTTNQRALNWLNRHHLIPVRRSSGPPMVGALDPWFD